MADQGDVLARVAASARYQRLVRGRSRFGWTLTAIMLIAYFGFILLVAFDARLLGRSLAGGATSLGIPLGLGLILLVLLLTAIYVRRANREFDVQLRAVIEEAGA